MERTKVGALLGACSMVLLAASATVAAPPTYTISVDKIANPMNVPLAGASVVYTVSVIATGTGFFGAVSVEDGMAGCTLGAPTGDDGDGHLEPAETWAYSCTVNGVTPGTSNTATVNACHSSGSACNQSTHDATGSDTVTTGTGPAVTEAPATEAPATEAPATEAPATEAPATEAPATEAPATEAPATEAPATEAPATEAPATEAPATEAPATEAPATEAPATEAPATEAPATEAPATEAPATEAPQPRLLPPRRLRPRLRQPRLLPPRLRQRRHRARISTRPRARPGLRTRIPRTPIRVQDEAGDTETTGTDADPGQDEAGDTETTGTDADPGQDEAGDTETAGTDADPVQDEAGDTETAGTDSDPVQDEAGDMPTQPATDTVRPGSAHGGDILMLALGLGLLLGSLLLVTPRRPLRRR